MNQEKTNKGYIIRLTIAICLALAIVAGGTYAYWIWHSTVNKDVVFNVIKSVEEYIVYNEGESHFIGDFQPTDYFCESANTSLSFYKKEEASDISLSATIFMDVNSIGYSISNSSDIYWVLTKGDNTITCDNLLNEDTVISYGTFQNVEDGNRITLSSNIEVTTTEQFFTIWIWIDDSELTLLAGDTLDINIWTRIDMIEGQANTPVLDDGMIPVTIASNGTVTTVNPTEGNWYNYSNKEWANAILVTAASRENYQEAGVPVTKSDILAYYVWIPRYKYKIWETDTSSNGEEQTIEIVFENVTEPLSTGTMVGQYRTPDAFWWDNDKDGVVDSREKLAGFWVGKFESSPDPSTTCYSSPSLENCNNTSQNPRILPSQPPLRGQHIGNQFQTSLNISKSNNIYGISNINIDSHMMKNSEWGAVAYLTYSLYGINKNIDRNNYYDNSTANYFKTGCGISSSSETATQKTCSNEYGTSNTNNYSQSTTGNITGIFDMSGGATEFVMGNYNNTLNTTYISSLPDSKYYNKYTSSTTTLACNNSPCYGHAMSETANWHSQYANIVTADKPWFKRSGAATDKTKAGMFYTTIDIGQGSLYNSWRSVLVPIVRNWGDVNLDGKVTEEDANLIMKYAIGATELPEEATNNADVNLDGSIDYMDARLVTQYIEGTVSSLPVPLTES